MIGEPCPVCNVVKADDEETCKCSEKPLEGINRNRSKLSPMMMLGIASAICGVSLDDMMEGAGATTPEEKAKAQVKVLRKMEAHRRGVSLNQVPDFYNYPETGRPPNVDV
jgi:predicted nucleic acid-binding Zn ribbon protein